MLCAIHPLAFDRNVLGIHPDGVLHIAKRLLDETDDPMLRTAHPLAVDLEDVSMLLDGDPVHGGGRVDLTTGEIWSGSPYDDPNEDDEEVDPER
jgi:hypothetical protein